MNYINMKVAFETMYIMLNQSHSLGRFQAPILEHIYVFSTNEPLWKWRGEIHNHFAGGQRGKFMRIVIQCKCVLILDIIKNFQVRKFLHQFLFKGIDCFMDRPTKVIGGHTQFQNIF